MVAREMEFAVWGNHHVQVLPPGEIHSNGQLYDYAGKYSDQPTPYTTIAEVPPEVAQEGMRIADTFIARWVVPDWRDLIFSRRRSSLLVKRGEPHSRLYQNELLPFDVHGE